VDERLKEREKRTALTKWGQGCYGDEKGGRRSRLTSADTHPSGVVVVA